MIVVLGMMRVMIYGRVRMSKLDDILIMAGLSGDLKFKKAEEIKDLMLELIGEDEVRPESGAQRNGIVQGLRRTRNKQRAELRKKVEEL